MPRRQPHGGVAAAGDSRAPEARPGRQYPPAWAMGFPQALVWLWCGFGVALVEPWWSLRVALGWLCTPKQMALWWPCGGFVLRSLCLVYAYHMALGWLWVACRPFLWTLDVRCPMFRTANRPGSQRVGMGLGVGPSGAFLPSWHFDLLRCSVCQSPMRVIAVIDARGGEHSAPPRRLARPDCRLVPAGRRRALRL